MLTTAVAKGATLIAVICTAITVPLAMLVAFTPSADEASQGDMSVELRGSDWITWALIAAAVLGCSFAIAAVLLTRSQNRSQDTTGRTAV